MSGNPDSFLADYFEITDVKDVLDIVDNVDDNVLESFGDIASTDITSKLFPFSDSLPLTGDLLTMATNACTYRVAGLYKAKKNNFELAKLYEGMFKTAIENLITLLKANRNTRTKRVSVNSDYITRATYAETRKW